MLCLGLMNCGFVHGEVAAVFYLKRNCLTRASSLVDMGYYKRSTWVTRERMHYLVHLCEFCPYLLMNSVVYNHSFAFVNSYFTGATPWGVVALCKRAQ